MPLRPLVQTPDLNVVECTYDGDLRMPPHVDEAFRISVVVQGRVQETHRNEKHVARALSVVTKPADAVHANRFGPEGACLLSIQTIPAFLDGPERSLDVLREWKWADRGPTTSAAARLIAACQAPVPEREAVVRESLNALVDALTDVPPRHDDVPPLWLQRVRDRLRTEWDRTPSVATLAEDAGVHPVSLSRRFRQHYGVPVTTYRRQVRVHEAAHCLASGPMPLASIALACGFCDQSHFTHAFRTETGWTPGRFRNAVRS